MELAIDEGEANAYFLGTVGLPEVNAFQGMSLKDLTINYSKVSVLSDEQELQLGILKSFSKAFVDQFSATIEKQIRERGPRAKKKMMQEIKSSLDAARKAQQSGKHQTSMGTPYPNSRSQQDARWQWVKRKAKPLEDVASAAVVAFLSTNAGAASAPNAAPVAVALGIPNPPRREPEESAKKKPKRAAAAIVECQPVLAAPMKKAATDSRSNLPEFTDMVSLFDATISQCLIPQLIAIATRILKNLSFIMKAHRVSESYSITNKYNFHLT